MRITSFLAYLAFTSLIMLGCVRRPTDVYNPTPLIFHFGQNVYVSEGFYHGCKGWIRGHFEDGVGNHYEVDGECPINTNNNTTAAVIFNAKESELVEDDSN